MPEVRTDGVSRLDIVGMLAGAFLNDGALGAWTLSTSAGTAGFAETVGTGRTAETEAGTARPSKALSGLAAAPRHIRRSPHRERG
ncbi:MAG: hypothetical protein ACI8XM_000058 [Haloarculaceae archaeon]